MDTKKIETVLTTVTIDSKVDSGKIDVVVGESAKMDVVKAVNYIQSGKAEIEAGVTEVFNQVDNHVAEKTAEFDQNAQDKTDAFNDNAVDKTGDFNDNYTNKLNAFNQNASDKTDAFDLNAGNKTGDFNTNATNKTTDFNDNYVAKKALIDAEVGTAQTAATNASNSADLSKQWAIGDPTEPSEGSAKYWAKQASKTLPNDGQLDIQVNGSSVATFTANQSGNTTANIAIPSSLPDQTGNAGKFLSTDGTDAGWQYGCRYIGSNYSGQTYIGDIMIPSGQYPNNAYNAYLRTSAAPSGSVPWTYSLKFNINDNITAFYDTGTSSIDMPIVATKYVQNVGRLYVGATYSSRTLTPTINNQNGLMKVPGGIDGYSPTSAFGTVAFSNDYGDLDNKPSIPTATSDLTNDSGFITVSALIGYATESWVTNKGYITGISSSDVTTALGYTPYNSSNPAGYITSSALPTVNNPTITITQGGTTKGSFSLNQASGDTIALDAGGIQNTATGTDSLSILGTASTYNQTVNVGVGSSNTGYNSTAVGYNTTAHEDGVAIGMNATASNYDAIAIGRDASVSGNNSIQLGYGTLTTNNIFQVWDYPLLDYSSGEIPDARISPNIARTSALPSITIQKVNSLPASPSSNILYCIPES